MKTYEIQIKSPGRGARNIEVVTTDINVLLFWCKTLLEHGTTVFLITDNTATQIV